MAKAGTRTSDRKHVVKRVPDIEKAIAALERLRKRGTWGKRLVQMDKRLTAEDEAWVAEAERRFSAWKRKRTKAFLADKAIAEIRKGLGR